MTLRFNTPEEEKRLRNRINIETTIKKYWLIPFILIKSLFLAIIQIAWGFVALGLMGWTFFFIKKEYPLVNLPEITPIIKIGVDLILNNMSAFFWTFFIVFSYFEIQELIKINKEKFK